MYRSMTTRIMAARRLEEVGVQEKAAQGVNVPQNAQVSPQHDHVLIRY